MIRLAVVCRTQIRGPLKIFRSHPFSTRISPTFEGKAPPDLLSSVVFPNLGAPPGSSVLVGPNVGIDGAVVKIGGKNVVLASDPVTGSTQDLGTLCVVCNANDIAVMGATPRYMLLTLLLPPGPKVVESLKQIMDQVHEACVKQGITVIGGHTEITSAVTKPVASVTMLGDQIRNMSGPSPGDSIIMTKSVALEGTMILLSERASQLADHNIFTPVEIESKKKILKEQLSVVPEALLAIQNEGVTSMHDPTEGGLSNAISEMMSGSSCGCDITFENIPISKDTEKICSALEINPLNLISSGTLVLTCKPESSEALLEELKAKGIDACRIGVVTHGGDLIMSKGGEKNILAPPETDALWAALEAELKPLSKE